MKKIIAIFTFIAVVLTGLMAEENYQPLNTLVWEQPNIKIYYNFAKKKECCVIYDDESNTEPMDLLSVIMGDLAQLMEYGNCEEDEIVKKFEFYTISESEIELFDLLKSNWFGYEIAKDNGLEHCYVYKVQQDILENEIVFLFSMSVTANLD